MINCINSFDYICQELLIENHTCKLKDHNTESRGKPAHSEGEERKEKARFVLIL